MVKRMRIVATAVLMITLSAAHLPAAENPVKWSAPMNQYPNQWSPSTPPPQYTYPYVYNQYVDPRGYGGSYGGAAYWGQGGQYPGYYGAAQQGFSGNPYHHYYYR